MSTPAMKLPLPRRATYADVLAAPAHKVAELINGELILSPRPAVPHAVSATGLAFGVMGPFQHGLGGPGRPERWWFLFEPELHFAGNVLVPDLAGWRRARMPQPPRAAHISQPPDWLCEVVSPSSARHDRIVKLDLYARAGVPHVWLVDPDAELLEAFRLEAGRWVRLGAFAGREKVRVEPFDAVELDMSLWWLPEPDAPAAEPVADAVAADAPKADAQAPAEAASPAADSTQPPARP